MITKATEHVNVYKNENGPEIGVTKKGVIEQDGLYFKDINGDGKLNAYKDWRNAPEDRAAALTKELPLEQKLGLLFVNSWKMGVEQKDENLLDESGLLNEEIVEKDASIFSVEKTYGTTYSLEELKLRNFIIRNNPTPEELVDWINQLNEVCEGEEYFVPVQVLSNSRNENGEVVFGMNDAAGVFAAWPGTMGIAAAIKGTNDLSIIDDWAECIRQEWDAVGMKKGYMYMADVVSDPRWQRTYGTFGEDPKLIADVFARLIPGVQGSKEGITRDGVAMTVKHFPGGGARENGFDPHYAEGQWNVYQTKNSLQKYHIPAFQVAVDHNTASIMPYYAKPSRAKSADQFDCNGNPISWQPVGFAFNKFFIDELLRKQMGFKGYVNSDSGITHMMAWGVEELDTAERIALAVNTGVDVMSGAFSVTEAKEAYERSLNGYYTTQGHAVPEGYTVEDVTLSEEALNRAVIRTLTERFTLGLFDNPYRDPKQATEVVATKKHWDDAYEVHCQSVVLLKNEDATLPLTAEKTAGKKIYVENFKKTREEAEKETEKLRKLAVEKFGWNLTEDYHEADYAVLLENPQSGNYFNATKGYLELDICEGKMVCDTDKEGRPTAEKHEETTLHDVAKIADIYEAVHANGGKVISNINVTLAWMVGNVEKRADALLVGFDTYPQATLDVITGRHEAVGKLPITLPKDDSVIAVNADGVCISPNDVPGFDKDQYMPDSMKDENGKAYAYRDMAGHYYELGFGLQ